MKNNRLACIQLIGIFFLLIFSSCQKDDNNDKPGPNGGSSTIKTQVIVKTTDASNVPVAGTLIKIGSSAAITDSKGFAIFQDVTVSNPRFVVTAQKSGKLDAVKGISVVSGTSVYYATLIMVTKPTPVTFDASTGGSVTLTSGASVTFSAGTVADASGSSYNGTVLVYAHHYKTDDPRFETMVPGGDLLGIDINGDDVSLVSFGMLKVDLVDPSGNPLNLLPGTTAQITIPIASSQQSSAPATIPLWYLDETTALWKEEGSATRQGNSYVGTVSHFSTWNCDYPGERADIIGKVVDCNNNPVPNVTVTLNGFLNVITNSNGVYTCWVPSGWAISYQVFGSLNQGLSSTNTVTFTAIANQVNNVPDLLIPCSSKIIGTLKDCNGNNSTGFIAHSYGSSTDYTFVNNGTFSMNVGQNGLHSLNFSSLNGLYDTAFTISQSPIQNYNIGNVNLCGFPAVPDSNSFYINGGPFNNYLIQLAPVTTTATTNSTGFYLTQFGSCNASTSGYNMEIQITGTSTGTYNIVTSSNGTFDYYQGDYHLSPVGVSDVIAFQVTSVGPIGGLVVCSFSGTATIYDQSTLSSFPVTISDGKLSFTRY